MNSSFLIGNEDYDCPICDRTHHIERRKRITQAVVKDEIVEFDEIFYLCPAGEADDNTFVPAGLMDENLLKARDAYRRKKGLLSSDEIASIRNDYGLSQNDFSTLLGWGEITVTRYETKSIQDATYDKFMRMSKDNPMFAFQCLEMHRSRFNAEKYMRIRSRIIEKIEEVGNQYQKKQEIESQYAKFVDESDLNGYKRLDLDKVACVLGYFARFIDKLYKVKLMKLLWYADSIYFGRYGHSMTGLVYKHMPLGALPIAYNELITLPTVKVIEEVMCEDLIYRILPNNNVSLSDFTLDELSVLEMVASRFKNSSAQEIINYMHAEKAYIETEPYQVIPYSLSRQLNELK